MIKKPVIFISCVSKELKAARALVAQTLHFIGYDTEWQEVFKTEGGDLRTMLMRRIDASNGLIQLVGKCYGVEPQVADPEFGRVSYTQFEALYARKKNKPVWYFFVGEEISASGGGPEDHEFVELQKNYIDSIKSGNDALFYQCSTAVELENRIFKIRSELDAIRRNMRFWGIGIVVSLILLLMVSFFIFRTQTKIINETGKVVETVNKTAISTQIAEAASKSAEASSKRAEEASNESLEQINQVNDTVQSVEVTTKKTGMVVSNTANMVGKIDESLSDIVGVRTFTELKQVDFVMRGYVYSVNGDRATFNITLTPSFSSKATKIFEGASFYISVDQKPFELFYKGNFIHSYSYAIANSLLPKSIEFIIKSKDGEKVGPFSFDTFSLASMFELKKEQNSKKMAEKAKKKLALFKRDVNNAGVFSCWQSRIGSGLSECVTHSSIMDDNVRLNFIDSVSLTSLYSDDSFFIDVKQRTASSDILVSEKGFLIPLVSSNLIQSVRFTDGSSAETKPNDASKTEFERKYFFQAISEDEDAYSVFVSGESEVYLNGKLESRNAQPWLVTQSSEDILRIELINSGGVYEFDKNRNGFFFLRERNDNFSRKFATKEKLIEPVKIRFIKRDVAIEYRYQFNWLDWQQGMEQRNVDYTKIIRCRKNNLSLSVGDNDIVKASCALTSKPEFNIMIEDIKWGYTKDDLSSFKDLDKEMLISLFKQALDATFDQRLKLLEEEPNFREDSQKMIMLNADKKRSATAISIKRKSLDLQLRPLGEGVGSEPTIFPILNETNYVYIKFSLKDGRESDIIRFLIER